MNKVIRIFIKDSTLIPVISIVLGLLIGALIMLLGAYNPIRAYASLIEKAFGDLYSIGETIRQITPLIFTGLSVAFAFRIGLFNIGAEGQFIIGSVTAAFVGIQFDLPWYIHVPFAVVAGGIAGGLWGSLAGLLKVYRGVHEVIATIMLNWIALYLSNYIVKFFLIEPGQQRSRILSDSSWLSSSWLSQLFDGARIHYGILLGLICTFLFYVILWKTRQGYELRAVGYNPDASEYAGIHVKKNIVRSMMVSGVFAGLGGASEVLGVFHYQTIHSVFPGHGFEGIAVALLGGNTAVGTILGAVLFGVLTFGATGMKFGAGVPIEIINIVIALVIFFVAASGLVKAIIDKVKKKIISGGSSLPTSQDWKKGV
ncbi:MAG: ABC transporter permease [Bacillaceae bacterium]|nr:ABC transporter permease [Bacillaceae bacterium]